MNPDQLLGRKGEILAARWLEQQGYQIVQQNYRTSCGEIDIIARDQQTLVFIEVKTRSQARFGHPKSAVTPNKQRKISLVALTYLKQTRQMDVRARFDVVAVITGLAAPSFELVQNAFELSYG